MYSAHAQWYAHHNMDIFQLKLYPDGRTSADLASDTGAGKRQPAPTAQGSPDRDGLGEFPPPSDHRRSPETSRKIRRFRRSASSHVQGYVATSPLRARHQVPLLR